jgi:hypothetical protein
MQQQEQNIQRVKEVRRLHVLSFSLVRALNTVIAILPPHAMNSRVHAIENTARWVSTLSNNDNDSASHIL